MPWSQRIDPAQANVGDPVMVTITVTGGTIGGVQFPEVDGFSHGGTSMQIKSTDENNASSVAVVLNFALIPTRPGDFTLPAFITAGIGFPTSAGGSSSAFATTSSMDLPGSSRALWLPGITRVAPFSAVKSLIA